MRLAGAGQRVQAYDAGSQSVAALLGAGWNPREVVFLPADAAAVRTHRVEASARVRHFMGRAGDLQSPSVSNGSAGTDSAATRTAFRHIEIEAEAAAPAVVVLAQNFYPGWRATVNGQPAPVLRANHAFQAIPIPAGQSTVRLDYVDWPFRIGALLSLATALGCLFLWRGASTNSAQSGFRNRTADSADERG